MGWLTLTIAFSAIGAQAAIAVLAKPLGGLSNVVGWISLLGIPSAIGPRGLFIDETRGLSLEVASRETPGADRRCLLGWSLNPRPHLGLEFASRAVLCPQSVLQLYGLVTPHRARRQRREPVPCCPLRCENSAWRSRRQPLHLDDPDKPARTLMWS